MNIIVLIIASDNTDHYVKMQDIWRIYRSQHPHIKCYFIKCQEQLEEDVMIENDTIYVKGVENYTPGILIKTIKSIDYLLKNENFDYIYRTNLSSFLNLNRLYQYALNHQFDYSGVMWQCDKIWVSGAGIFLSKKACETLIDSDLKNVLRYDLIDDVAIGVELTKHYSIYPGNRCDIIDTSDIKQYHLDYRGVSSDTICLIMDSEKIFIDTNPDIFHYRCKNNNSTKSIDIMNKLLYYIYQLGDIKDTKDIKYTINPPNYQLTYDIVINLINHYTYSYEYTNSYSYCIAALKNIGLNKFKNKNTEMIICRYLSYVNLALLGLVNISNVPKCKQQFKKMFENTLPLELFRIKDSGTVQTFDHFHHLSTEARINGKHLECYHHCQRALEFATYQNEWLIYYELAVVAFYTPFKSNGLFYSQKVITSPFADPAVVNHVKNNMVYYK